MLLKIEVSKTTFVEKDPTKKCSKYMNKNFASYKDCDDQYLSKICNQEGLFPICLNDFEKVTKQKINMALMKE